MQLQFKCQVVPTLPRVRRQQRRPGGEIGQRGGIGRRRLGALARDQIELGYLLPLVWRRDEGSPAVQMIDNLEDRLLPRFRENVCLEQSSDSEMGLRTQCWRYH